MTKTLFFENLPWSTSEIELEAHLLGVGIEPARVRIIIDRETGRSRGFGFVDVAADQAQAVIQALDGQDLGGRILRVDLARSRKEVNTDVR